MDKALYLTSLYDYYGDLLTEKQQSYFEDYYFNNYSLSEIADNYEYSRNAIHKQIKDVENKLIHYEEKLNLLDKKQKLERIIVDLDQTIKEEIEKLI